MSRLPITMSLTWAISMWLLVTYMLIASASFTDKIVPLCVRQPPTQLQFREHQEHYQGTHLQAAAHSASPIPLLTPAVNLSSSQPTDNGTVFELVDRLATHTNTTQLSDSLENLDLARGTEDSGESPYEEQHNDTSNGLDGEECPVEIDMLDCDECGGPEQTWEIAHNDYHCKGVSTFVTHNYK